MPTFERYRALIERYMSELLSKFGERIKAIVIFGSVARDEAREDSDIDMLMVVSDKSRELHKQMISVVDRAAEDWEEMKDLHGSGIRTDVFKVVKTERELRDNPLILLDILDHGRILYDPEGVMRGLLNDLDSKMRELGSNKIVFEDGRWCWDLKPDWRPGEIVEIKL